MTGLYAVVVQVMRLLADEIQVGVRVPLAVQVLWYHPAPSRRMRMRVGAASQLVAVAMAAAAPGGGGKGSTRS